MIEPRKMPVSRSIKISLNKTMIRPFLALAKPPQEWADFSHVASQATSHRIVGLENK